MVNPTEQIYKNTENLNRIKTMYTKKTWCTERLNGSYQSSDRSERLEINQKSRLEIIM